MVVEDPKADGAVCASVAELAGVLSLATDVALGYSYEHGLRRAVLAVGLAEAVGADAAMVEEAYFVSLLMYIGCTAEASVFAGLFGDELAFGAAVAPHVWGSPRELMRAGMPFIGSGHTGLRRVGAVARALPVMKEQMELGGAGHCEVAQMLAVRLALVADRTARGRLTLVGRDRREAAHARTADRSRARHSARGCRGFRGPEGALLSRSLAGDRRGGRSRRRVGPR